MSNIDSRTMLQKSRRIADSADFLSMTLRSGNEAQIEETVDDLLMAYDNYTGEAEIYSARFKFDDIAKVEEPLERDQRMADALAGALIDLEIAQVMGQAAQVTGEIEGQADQAALDQAITTFNEMLRAVAGRATITTETTRLAFDEVIAAGTGEVASSLDILTAKTAYAQQVDAFYDTLLTESKTLLTTAFEELSQVDVDKIKQGLKGVTSVLEKLPGGRLIKRAWEAIKRAIETLKGILGDELLDKIEDRVSHWFDQFRQGGDLMQNFLVQSYGCGEGRQKVTAWLQSSQVAPAKLDAGAREIRELQQEAVQIFTLARRIINVFKGLSQPVEWLFNKIGGTLPFALIQGSVFILVIDIALLRGMDYADNTMLIKWVDGVLILSRKTLEITA